MRLRMVSFTRRGALLCAALSQGLRAQGHECEAYAMPRHVCEGLLPLTQPLTEWTREAFSQAQGLIFVCACGIAVRACAPCLAGKTRDPAVIAIDDGGRFVVPLLSGHIGGANALALQAAQIIGAQPVISTATDGGGLFAVDSWAAENGLYLSDMTAAKRVSAALLDGEPVGFCSDFPVAGDLPEGFVAAGRDGVKTGVQAALGEKDTPPFDCTLTVIPPALTLGIGCRKGASAQAIEAHVLAVLSQNGMSPRAVGKVCTIDLKANEQGLLDFCSHYKLPLTCYSADELARAEGSFTASEFVRGVTGVDNVCERAAVLGGGRLLVQKQSANGVTAALALQEWSIRF